MYQKDFHKSINREYFENTIENMSPTLFTSGYEERYSLPPYRSPTKMNEKITFEESHLSKKFLPRLIINRYNYSRYFFISVNDRRLRIHLKRN